MISDRAQLLLKLLIERYIREGQPIGSSTLADALAIEGSASLSPATIRNVLADLEECGYLRSPHTSAGRVPTVQGYRFFVDTLLTVKPLQLDEVQQVQQKLANGLEPDQLLLQAGEALSDLTHCASFVMLPKPPVQLVSYIEFLPLSEKRVLVVLVINETEVQNRLIYVDRDYSREELALVSHYLQQHCLGRDLMDIRNLVIDEMKTQREGINRLLGMAIDVAEKALEPALPPQDQLLIKGQTHLVKSAMQDSDMTGLADLFLAFNERRTLLHLLDRCLSASGMQIFIGEESGYQVFDDWSMITAPYVSQGRVMGVLGVVGPQRMPYDRVISAVDVTARLLGLALNSKRNAPSEDD